MPLKAGNVDLNPRILPAGDFYCGRPGEESGIAFDKCNASGVVKSHEGQLSGTLSNDGENPSVDCEQDIEKPLDSRAPLV